MPARTEVFTKLVRDYMGSAPVIVPAGEQCDRMVERIRTGESSSAIVVDEADKAVGIVTEQDICRKLALRLPADTPVEAVMSRPVWTVDAGDRLFHAIGQMRRRKLRHMPVVDSPSGEIVGVLELQVALSIAAAQMVEQIDELTHTGTLSGMEQTKRAQVKVAEQLFEDATPAVLEHALQVYRAHYREHCLDHTRLYPGVRSTLEHFRDKRQAVVSNKTAEFSRLILGGLGLLDLVRVVFGGDIAGALKPDPAPVQAALAALGVGPTQAVMVGDGLTDLEAGRRAGTRTCAVTYGLNDRSELTPGRPDHWIDDFSSLRELFV